MNDPAQAHHRIFEHFPPWSGRVPKGFVVDYLGVLTRPSFFKLLDDAEDADRDETTPLPAFDEEYFEWIALLEAVLKARGG